MKHTALAMDRLRDVVQGLPRDALTATREAALANLDEHGLPTLRHEDWKYTDLGAAIDISNRWLEGTRQDSASESLDSLINEITSSIDANWLVIANGHIDLAQFSECSGIDVERFSESAAPFVMDRPLADLNAALLHDGLRIHVTAATEKPLALLVVDNADADAVVSQANVELIVAPGCDAEFIEYQASCGNGDYYGNSVVALQIGEGAAASCVRIQDRKNGHVQTSRLSIAMHKDSRLDMTSYDLGGALVRTDVDIDICEPGVEATFNGLYLAGDGQHIDNHTVVNHRVGPATSFQEYRGILNGQCRCVWNGKAIVHKGADGTDANQANNNLLLSDKAEIDAKPELEIYADDVKCSHGTTVGQLDETALFYLRTRGLDKRQATQILVHAFATDLIGRTPVDVARERITSLVESRLEELIRDDAT
jgi:Fe-S cluster assembly protein SufD